MALSTRCALLIAGMVPTVVGAQRSPLAKVGDRVRITAPESGIEQITGSVVAIDSGLVTVKSSGERGLFYVRRGQIEAFDISAARERHMLGGMAVGALNGIMLGVGFADRAGGDRTADQSPATSDAKLRQGAVVGAVGGVIVGAIFGLITVSDDWVAVSVDHPPVGKPTAVVGKLSLRWSVTY